MGGVKQHGTCPHCGEVVAQAERDLTIPDQIGGVRKLLETAAAYVLGGQPRTEREQALRRELKGIQDALKMPSMVEPRAHEALVDDALAKVYEIGTVAAMKWLAAEVAAQCERANNEKLNGGV